MTRYDVITLGAGPGGAAAATLLSKAGHRVLMLDRGQQPNTHLPESWFGEGQNVLARLGIDSIGAAHVDQTEVQFFTAAADYGLRIHLQALHGDGDPPPVRLNRIEFDRILVENAVRSNVVYAPNHLVTDLDARDGAVRSVQCQTPDGLVEYAAEMVIDASGKSALLANHLGLKGALAKLDQRVAVFSHFTDVAPGPLARPGSMSIVSVENGYIFVIPIDAERISVGVVIGERAAGTYGGDLERLFQSEVQSAPVVLRMLEKARRVLPVIPALNETYVCRSVAAPGYLLVGDAAAFLDPFYSNGIDIALESGALAADTTDRMLRSSAPAERRSLARGYDTAFRQLLEEKRNRAYARFAEGPERRLLLSCADPHLPAVLPLAILMQQLGRGGASAADRLEPAAAIRTARLQFASL